MNILYGGTKAEMQRLIKDASQMTDVQEKLNITVDGTSMSFDNVVNAISVVQEKMGIAGTSAKEGTETIEGSMNRMKAAWSNLITGMADENADVAELTNTFVDTLVGGVDEAGNKVNGALQNIMPAIERTFMSLGEITSKVVPEIIGRLPNVMEQLIPALIQTTGKIIAELVKKIPDLMKSFVKAVVKVFDTLGKEIPKSSTMFRDLGEIVKDASKIVLNIADIIKKNLVPAFKSVWPVVEKVISFLGRLIHTIANNEGVTRTLEMAFRALSGIIEVVTWAIGGIIDFFSENESVTWGVVNAVIALVGAIGTYKAIVVTTKGLVAAWNTVTGLATAAQTGLNAAMAANPVGVVITAIVSLIGALTLLYNNCKEFRDFIDNFWTYVRKGYEQIGRWIEEFLGYWHKGYQTIMGWISDIGNALANFFGFGKSGTFDAERKIYINETTYTRGSYKPYSMPQLAEGGVLKRGQIAFLEGEGDEAVIPLSKNTEWLDSVADRLSHKLESDGQQSNYYNIHVEVANMNANSREEIEKLAETLMQIMSEKTTRRGVAFR